MPMASPPRSQTVRSRHTGRRSEKPRRRVLRQSYTLRMFRSARGAAHRNAVVGVEALCAVGFTLAGVLRYRGRAFERSTGSFSVEKGRKNPAVHKKLARKMRFVSPCGAGNRIFYQPATNSA